MRLHLVVNPVAGRGAAGSLGDGVAAALRAAGDEVALHRTASAAEARQHVAGLAADACDRLVVVGGDGTLKDVLNARPLPLPWPVGLVPVGTANVVGRELRMPLAGAPELRAAALRAAEPWTVDLLALSRPDGTVERAVANVGAGLDAAIVAAVAEARHRQAGRGGYAVWVGPILRTVARYRFPRLLLTVDGERTYAGSAVVVQGARNYGGVFELAPGAALDAGALSVSLLEGRTRRDLLRLLVRAALRRAGRDAHLRTFRARQVTLTADPPALLQADGDPAGTTPVTITLLPRAVRLLRAPRPA